MTIWSSEIKELETLHTSIKGRFPELEKELERLIKADDENMVLLYSRRCLEVIITDLCEFELKRPRKTEPLKGIIDKLHHEEKIPSHIIASMQNLNTLSTFGAHPKEFDPEQVRPVLINLTTIIKWYLKYKDTKIISKPEAEEVTDETKVPDDSTGQIKIPKKKLILLLSGFVLVVVLVVVALFVFNIIGGDRQIKDLEKSIAVLPFKLLSDEPDKQYLADGMMDAILLHLSKIEDLRVMSRTSMEQYRVPSKTVPEIGRELGVEYLLEGSFQKSGDNVKLIVQLIQARQDDHVWSNEYDRNWNDIFSVQSEVAQVIASELHAVITPEEKQLIEKTPTKSLKAYDLYQRGREAGNIDTAEVLFHKALEYDSTFAQAYIGLANIYWGKQYWEAYFSENFLDSVLILADIALSYNNQLAEAYLIKGYYYSAIGKPEQAVEEFDKAIKFNPNDWNAYYNKGHINQWVLDDFVESIENLHEAVIRYRGENLPIYLASLGRAYLDVGFIDKARSYYQEAFTLDGDSFVYFDRLAWLELSIENFKDAYYFKERVHKMDTNYLGDLPLYSSISGHHDEAYTYAKKLDERMKISGGLSLQSMHRIGYAFWKVGKYEEAEHYFNEQIRIGNESIRLGRDISSRMAAHYDLAGVYAFLGEKENAYQYLDEFNKKNFYPLWWLSLAKHDPLFDNIREEERFQKILENMEIKHQAEHERVRKWLEEQGML